MIPKISDRDLSIFRGQAIRELNLSPDVGDPEIRDAFLDALGKNDLQPLSPALYRSIRMLDRVPQSIPCRCLIEPFLEDQDAAEGREVDQFCDSFFTLEPSVRRSKWQELGDSLRATSIHRLRHRQLARGLSIDLRTLANASFEARKVAERIFAIFCMPLYDRPDYRRKVLQDHAVVIDLLRKGAEELRVRHPDVLGLDIRFAEMLGLKEVSLESLRNRARANSRNSSQQSGFPGSPQNPDQPQPKSGWKTWAPIIVLAIIFATAIPIASNWNARRIAQNGDSQSNFQRSGGSGYSGGTFQPNNFNNQQTNSTGGFFSSFPNIFGNSSNVPNPNGVPGRPYTPSYTPPNPNSQSRFSQRGFNPSPTPRYSPPTSYRSGVPSPGGGYSPPGGGNFGPGRR